MAKRKRKKTKAGPPLPRAAKKQAKQKPPPLPTKPKTSDLPSRVAEPANIFLDPDALSSGVNSLHDALCDVVQALTVKQKRAVFKKMGQVADMPDRCSVFVPVGDSAARQLPLGFVSVYRLLKGTTR
jgi:hypothetical protein